MKRRIVGFDRDDNDDWRAELDCGHYQHVRHDPPLITREWVLTEIGRREKIGVELECKKCDTADADKNGIFSASDDDFPEGMNARDLIDHIIGKHHVFTRQETVRLSGLFKEVSLALGEQQPELHELQQLFYILHRDLFSHMKKEETMIFPYIRALENANSNGSKPEAAAFGSVRNPIKMLRWEHEETNNIFHRMKQTSAGYRLPDEACPSYRSLYNGIQELEKDLQHHIHLENDILFPLAGVIEIRVFSTIN